MWGSTTVIAVLLASIQHSGLISSQEVVPAPRSKTTGNNAFRKETEHNYVIRRFIHGCPFAFPCPPPPCDNPVFGPHDCCGSCPDQQPEVSTSPVQTYKRRSDKKHAFRKHMLDKYADENIDVREMKMTTAPPTTASECPYPCTYNGQHYCHPFPCYIRCVDSTKPQGSCCEVCPNGPNCRYNGHVIPEGKNATFGNGLVVYCANGDLYGGNLHIYQPTHVVG